MWRCPCPKAASRGAARHCGLPGCRRLVKRAAIGADEHAADRAVNERKTHVSALIGRIVRSPGEIAQHRTAAGRHRPCRFQLDDWRRRHRLEPRGGLVEPHVAAAIDRRGLLIQHDFAGLCGRRPAIDELDHIVDGESIETRHQIQVGVHTRESRGLFHVLVAKKVGIVDAADNRHLLANDRSLQQR